MRTSGTNISATGHKAGLGNVLYDKAGARPDLDLDFARTKSLKDKVSKEDLITFTRDSTGTYIDNSGIIQSATTNTPRFTHDPVTKESKGLLIEQQSTNFQIYSQSLASWIHHSAASGSYDNSIQAPDGTYGSVYSKNNQNEIYQPWGTIPSGTTQVTFSYFAKRNPNVSSNIIQFEGFRYSHALGNLGFVNQFDIVNKTFHTHLDNTSSGLTNPSNEYTRVSRRVISNQHFKEYPNGWIRVFATITLAASEGDFLSNSARVDVQGPQHYIWGVQVEAGAVGTSYIPTTTAEVTRSPDLVKIDGDNFGTYRTNLIPNTSFRKNFDSYTITKGIHQNYAALSPSGKFDAAKLTADPNINNNQRLWKYVTVQASQKYSVSAYVKAGTSSKCAIGLFDGSEEDTKFQVADIDLAANPPTIDNTYLTHTFTNTSVTDVGNGWYRAQFTSTAVPLSTSNAAGIIFVANSSGNLTFTGNGESMFMWGLQVEKADTPTPFIPSTDEFTSRSNPTATYVDGTGLIKTASANEARYSHDPETLTPTGLYLEPAATNLVTYSEDLTQWVSFGSGSGTTLTHTNDTSVTNPSGTTGATKVQITRTDHASQFRCIRHPAINRGVTDQSTVSFWIKAATTSDVGKSVSVWQHDGGFKLDVKLTLTNNWVRHIFTASSTDANVNEPLNIGLVQSTTGANNTEMSVGYYVWGAQFENGTVGTSYIPTSGATATRSADIFTSTATEVLDRANGTKPAFYTKSGLTTFTNGIVTRDSVARRFFEFGAPATTFTVTTSTTGTRAGIYQPNPSGSSAGGSGPGVDLSADGNKIAARYATNNLRVCTDGTLGNLDTDVDTRSPTTLFIGRWYVSGNNSDDDRHLQGTINRLTIWKTPFTDNKLQRITS